MTYPVLAIETTGSFASVALKDTKGNIRAETLKEKLNHLKGLLPLTHEVLSRADLEISDVKTIAVSQGPGSFTGIRIGISTVRALAQITGAKVIGVPTLEAFVYNNPRYGGIVCPVFDARMEQMYAGAFVLKDNRIQTLIKTDAYKPADYCNMLMRIVSKHKDRYKMPLDFAFYGDGTDVFELDIVHWGGRMHENHYAGFSYTFENTNRLQLATSVLKWAENFGEEIDYKELFPTYIRKAEAQRRLDEKNVCK